MIKLKLTQRVLVISDLMPLGRYIRFSMNYLVLTNSHYLY